MFFVHLIQLSFLASDKHSVEEFQKRCRPSEKLNQITEGQVLQHSNDNITLTEQYHI